MENKIDIKITTSRIQARGFTKEEERQFIAKAKRIVYNTGIKLTKDLLLEIAVGLAEERYK